MTLRNTCREIVLEAVLRRAMNDDHDVEGSSRLQLIVDETTQHVINSFLRMADLTEEGVTSIELIEKPREPIPDLDALYLLKPDEGNLERVLEDFKTQGKPQHALVHLAYVKRLVQDYIPRLASSAQLAPRVRSLVEVPLSFLTIQDRGFHFDMPEALTHLFPSPDGKGQELIVDISQRLADVCRCLHTTSPIIRHAQSKLCKLVAECVQKELQGHKGNSKAIPVQLVIVDRSIDMAAALVHEYTYEAMAYDLLDGTGMLDIDRHIVNLSTATPTDQCKRRKSQFGNRLSQNAQMEKKESEDVKKKEAILSDKDSVWETLKHMHIADAKVHVQQMVSDIASKAAGTKGAGDIDTADLLEQLRKSPAEKDTIDKLDLHLQLCSQVFKESKTERLNDGIGLLEQDLACGVDQNAKPVSLSTLQEQLKKHVTGMDYDLPSDTKLRLLMLFFGCVSNIQESLRQKLMAESQLDTSDHHVLMAMLRSKLMESPDSQKPKGGGLIHRNSKELIQRFKQIAQIEGRYALSRFEPRVTDIARQLAAGRLSEEAYPSLSDESGAPGLRATAAGTSAFAPGAPVFDDWGFDTTPLLDSKDAGKVASGEVKQRIIVFVIGGVMYSELRATTEIKAEGRANGVEFLVGGTSILTPKGLIRLLRPSSNPHEDSTDVTQDAVDLT